jgi:ABC-2 type transport system ATP-binding protein
VTTGVIIKTEHLSKKYHNKFAVDDISFAVETGKVIGFLGPNGAEKSTTIRLMLGLDSGKGATTFDGMALRSYDRLSNVVGILLEAKAFHPIRTARNNLKVLATAGGISN